MADDALMADGKLCARLMANHRWLMIGCSWLLMADCSRLIAGDWQYLVYGGMDKTVHVLDGQTGHPIFDIGCAGPVWTVALLDVDGAGDVVAYGGEFGQ
eukprot:5543983-Prymnesium_polylepis.2